MLRVLDLEGSLVLARAHILLTVLTAFLMVCGQNASALAESDEAWLINSFAPVRPEAAPRRTGKVLVKRAPPKHLRNPEEASAREWRERERLAVEAAVQQAQRLAAEQRKTRQVRSKPPAPAVSAGTFARAATDSAKPALTPRNFTAATSPDPVPAVVGSEAALVLTPPASAGAAKPSEPVKVASPISMVPTPSGNPSTVMTTGAIPLPRPAAQARPSIASDLAAQAREAAAERGKRLWLQRRGPRHAALEDCDLGLGPGRVVGTFAHLPRYFADAARVMDLETRIAWCARSLQDISLEELAKPRTFDGAATSELHDVVVYVVSLSSSWRLAPPSEHPKERQAVEVGQALYVRRQGSLDFSCATCHGSPSAQGVPAPQAIKAWQGRTAPMLASAAEARSLIGSWPAWRGEPGDFQTLQGRIAECFALMSIEPPKPASDAMVALIAYVTRLGEQGEVLGQGRAR